MVEAKEGERVGLTRYLCNLQEPLRAKSHKVLESVSEAVNLAIELMNDAVVASSPGTNLIVDSRIDELMGQ